MGTKLRPIQGIPAGLFAGVGMLIVWMFGAAKWGDPQKMEGAWELLTSIGDVIPMVQSQTWLPIAGVVLHLLIATGLGLLFAASLDRLDSKDTLIVATFYGFTLWVVSVLLLGHWIQVEAVQMSRSWWGFFAFLTFGFLLGVYANLFGQSASN